MPSRPAIIGIVVFWMAAMGWMFYQEMLPYLGADEAPPLYFDVGDEVERHIRWNVWHNKKMVGILDTRSKRMPDRTYQLRADYNFKGTMRVAGGPNFNIGLRNIYNAHWVTRDGRLTKTEMEVKLHFKIGKLPAEILDVEYEGEVEDEQLHSTFKVRGLHWEKMTPIQLNPVKLPSKGQVVNTMHPLHKVTGLFEGRRWAIPEFNPMAAAISNITITGVAENVKVPRLVAVVHPDTLTWQGQEVRCWRIDYAEPGKKNLAQTWVRRSDGLVLEQQAAYGGMELLIRRMTTK